MIPAPGHLPVPHHNITQSMTGNNNLTAEKDQLLNCCNLQANIWKKTRANARLL